MYSRGYKKNNHIKRLRNNEEGVMSKLANSLRKNGNTDTEFLNAIVEFSKLVTPKENFTGMMSKLSEAFEAEEKEYAIETLFDNFYNELRSTDWVDDPDAFIAIKGKIIKLVIEPEFISTTLIESLNRIYKEQLFQLIQHMSLHAMAETKKRLGKIENANKAILEIKDQLPTTLYAVIRGVEILKTLDDSFDFKQLIPEANRQEFFQFENVSHDNHLLKKSKTLVQLELLRDFLVRRGDLYESFKWFCEKIAVEEKNNIPVGCEVLASDSDEVGNFYNKIKADIDRTSTFNEEKKRWKRNYADTFNTILNDETAMFIAVIETDHVEEVEDKASSFTLPFLGSDQQGKKKFKIIETKNNCDPDIYNGMKKFGFCDAENKRMPISHKVVYQAADFCGISEEDWMEYEGKKDELCSKATTTGGHEICLEENILRENIEGDWIDFTKYLAQSLKPRIQAEEEFSKACDELKNASVSTTLVQIEEILSHAEKAKKAVQSAKQLADLTQLIEKVIAVIRKNPPDNNEIQGLLEQIILVEKNYCLYMDFLKHREKAKKAVVLMEKLSLISSNEQKTIFSALSQTFQEILDKTKSITDAFTVESIESYPEQSGKLIEQMKKACEEQMKKACQALFNHILSTLPTIKADELYRSITYLNANKDNIKTLNDIADKLPQNVLSVISNGKTLHDLLYVWVGNESDKIMDAYSSLSKESAPSELSSVICTLVSECFSKNPFFGLGIGALAFIVKLKIHDKDGNNKKISDLEKEEEETKDQLQQICFAGYRFSLVDTISDSDLQKDTIYLSRDGAYSVINETNQVNKGELEFKEGKLNRVNINQLKDSTKYFILEQTAEKGFTRAANKADVLRNLQENNKLRSFLSEASDAEQGETDAAKDILSVRNTVSGKINDHFYEQKRKIREEASKPLNELKEKISSLMDSRDQIIKECDTYMNQLKAEVKAEIDSHSNYFTIKYAEVGNDLRNNPEITIENLAARENIAEDTNISESTKIALEKYNIVKKWVQV